MPLDQSISTGGLPPEPPSASQKLGDELRMSFGEHIEDLRRRLILAIVGVFVASCLTFYFGFEIIGWLAKPFVQALSVQGFPNQLYIHDPTMGFGLYLQVSVISAVIVAAPWVIYQLWAFIAAGLYEHEKRAAYLLAPFSTAMTVLGVAFAYYIMLPVSLLFFTGFATLYPKVDAGPPSFMFRMLMAEQGVHAAANADSGAASSTGSPSLATLPVLKTDPPHPHEGNFWINGSEGEIKAFYNGRVHAMTVSSSRMLAPLPEIGQYIHFAVFMGLSVVIAFQVPVVMLVIGWTGLVDPQWLRPMRKYAFFGCAVAGAVLTPSYDALSMLLLTLPLYGLFELGLLLMRAGYARRPMSGED